MTGLENLPTTKSGAIKKEDAVRWLNDLEKPSDEQIKGSIEAKPKDQSGSQYATETSNIRITGDPDFVETVAGLFKPFLEMEDSNYRLEIKLQETEDRDTGELTGNYALYLSVAERG